MKTLVIFFLASIIGITNCFAGSNDTIIVPFGSTVTIDGAITGTEWADASTVSVSSIGGTVYFKHSSTHLYVAFTDLNSYYNSAGIYIDKLHDTGSLPKSDDIWIHGSAGPFEWFGNGSAWQSTTPADWSYSSNTANEFSISLSKLGITLDSNNVMGVLFSFLDWCTTPSEITWPDGGRPNLTNPDSWATMIIESQTVNIKTYEISQKEDFNIYPNPAADKITIDNYNQENDLTISISNINGQELIRQTISKNNSEIDVSELVTGVYFVKLIIGQSVNVRKFIKY